jgi:hypothetical protein
VNYSSLPNMGLEVLHSGFAGGCDLKVLFAPKRIRA